MNEYISKSYQSTPQPSVTQERQTIQAPDWKREKEIWKQIIDQYHYRHYKTRRIPSSV